MTKPRKSDETGGERAVEEQPDPARPAEKTGKTLQELERIQFDALDRAGFDR